MSDNPYDAPSQTGVRPVQSAGTRTRSVVIKRLDVMSCGVMLGALYVIVGLVVGAVFFLFSIAALAVGGEQLAGGLVGGIAVIVLLPLFYGAMGFIAGIIGALLYNLVAGMAGGIRMDLET